MSDVFDDAERDDHWRRAVNGFGATLTAIPTPEKRAAQLIRLRYIDLYIADLDRKMQLARVGIIPYGERA